MIFIGQESTEVLNVLQLPEVF